MKKSIVLEYLSPVEFLAVYTQTKFEKEKKELEDLTGKSLYDLIAMTQEDEDGFWNFHNTNIIEDFANGQNYLLCEEHEIFHKYDSCPFCSLDIEM